MTNKESHDFRRGSVKRFYSLFIICIALSSWTNFAMAAITIETFSPPTEEVQYDEFDISIIFSEKVGYTNENLKLVVPFSVGITTLEYDVEATDPDAQDRATHWTLTIRPKVGEGGDININLPEGVWTNADGEGNPLSDSFIVGVDLSYPTVTIEPPFGTQTGAFDVEIRFSKPVEGFEAGEISLSGNAATDAEVTLSGSGTNYTATITPAVGKEGTITIEVPEGVAVRTSNADIANTASGAHNVTVIAPPTVTIEPPSGTQTEAFDVDDHI